MLTVDHAPGSGRIATCVVVVVVVVVVVDVVDVVVDVVVFGMHARDVVVVVER